MSQVKSVLLATTMMLFPGLALAQVGPNEYPLGAVLPTGRTAPVGETVTAWASLINTSANAADCHINQWSSEDAPYLSAFHYQAYSTDGLSAQGAPDTPVSVAGGGSQNFLLTFVASQPFAPRDIELGFGCSRTSGNADMVWGPVMTGTNTFKLAATSAATPDVLVVADSTSKDAIVHLPSYGGVEAMALAALNIGSDTASGSMYAVPDFGEDRLLPFTLTICETNPADGTCLAPPATEVLTSMGSGVPRTFTIFASGDQEAGAQLYPDIAKIGVTFYDAPASGMSVAGGADPVLLSGPASGTRYGASSLALESPGPGPGYPGLGGPFEAVLMQENGTWWTGRMIGDFNTSYNLGTMIGKFDLPGQDWSYYVYGIAQYTDAGGGKLAQTLTDSGRVQYSWVVFNDDAFPTERRRIQVSGDFDNERGFRLQLDQLDFSTLSAPKLDSVKEALSGPVTVRGVPHQDWKHDLTDGSLIGHYGVNGNPGSDIAVDSHMAISGSFADGVGGTCVVTGNSLLRDDVEPNANQRNDFKVGMYVSGCAFPDGFYSGLGSRMLGAATAMGLDPDSLWIVMFHYLDTGGRAVFDQPMDLILVPQTPS